MKRTKLFTVILLFAALCFATVPASAATQFSDGVYTFEKTENQCAVITDCNLTDSHIDVPALVLGYPVVGVGSFAFFSNSYIREVSLPYAVSSIGEYAFANNEGLTAVFIPRTCSEIAANAFWNSPNVTIYCRYGSAADTYAREQHIPCVYLDNVSVGDANADGKINVNDVTAIQRYLSEIEPLEGIGLLAADVGQNGSVEIDDATALQMYLAEYEITCPIGEPIGSANTPEAS